MGIIFSILYAYTRGRKSVDLLTEETGVKMKEYAVEKHLISVTRACGGMCIKFTSPGMSGVPDRIVILPGGKIGFAEMKAPGKKPRRLQRNVLRRLYQLGCRVCVIDNLESAENFIRRLAQ